MQAWQQKGAAAIGRIDAPFVLLGVLCLVLPFELEVPVFRAGPLQITNVEIVWYLLILAWGVRRLRTGPTGWTITHSAVLLWAAVIALSAALAPSFGEAAWRFALRSLGGCALFFATADLARTPARAGRLMIALALGATASAAAAVAEVWLPASQVILSAFKTEPTRMGGFLRAGGTFQYPNIGAMYWEAAYPVAVAAGAWWAARRGRPLLRAAAVCCAAILMAGIVLSASRGGIFTALVLSSLMVFVPPIVVPGLRAPAAIVGLVLAVLTLTAGRLPALRLQSGDVATWYRAEYRITAPSAPVKAGQSFAATVTVRNTGLVVWRATGDHPVTLGYCWSDPAARAVACSGARSRLPRDVLPQEEATLVTQVLAPPTSGAYQLQWDMVEEGVAWFRGYGAQTGDLGVQVEPAGQAAAMIVPLPETVILFQPPPDRLELWRAALRLWTKRPLLGVGPDNFRRRYAEVLGLARYDDRTHANSLYMETLATLGLLGVAALFGLMAALVVTARRGWQAADSSERRILGFGLLLGVSAFFIHGLVDYFLPFMPTCGLFWVLTGAMVGLSPGGVRGHRNRHR